jgi:hypothetical protein
MLDARHPDHGRVEDEVRTTKDTSLAHVPSKSWDANKAWCHAVTIATDLPAWFRLLGCEGALPVAEPKTLRCRVLGIPPGSPEDNATDGCAYPATGPGRPPSSTRSPRSAASRCQHHSPAARRVEVHQWTSHTPDPTTRRTQETTPAGATALKGAISRINLDWTLVWNRAHLQRVLTTYLEHHNTARPPPRHQPRESDPHGRVRGVHRSGTCASNGSTSSAG